MGTLFGRILYWFRQWRHRAELREEMETHRALRQAALEGNGLRPELPAAEPARARHPDARSRGCARRLDRARTRKLRRFDRAMFDGAFAWANDRFDLAQGGRTLFVDGAYVSGDAFEVLGIVAQRGRPIHRDDDTPDAREPVAVISDLSMRHQHEGLRGRHSL